MYKINNNVIWRVITSSDIYFVDNCDLFSKKGKEGFYDIREFRDK